MRVNKVDLLRQLQEMVEGDLSTITRGFERARTSAIEAEGRMVSRYDSTKEEAGQLATAISGQIAALQDLKRLLGNAAFTAKLSAADAVRAGSLVTVEEDGEEFFYFIIPGGAGRAIILPSGEKVLCINHESPLGRALVGKRVGEEAVLPLKPIPRVLHLTNNC